MSSSKRTRNTGEPPAKRRKAETDGGIPTPQSQPLNAPSTSTFSVRYLRSAEHIPSLSTICARAFASHLQELSSNMKKWDDVKYSLRDLPDTLVQKVFAALRQICPTLLNHGLIASYFLRGTAIVLTDDLPGVGRPTIHAIGDMPSKDNLRDLEITGFPKIADGVFASVIAKLPSLRKLNLRGCTKVGADTATSAADHCPLLEAVNFSYTVVSPASLALLMFKCTHLEVLKVAGIASWTDNACSKIWQDSGSTKNFHFPNLRSLKLRQAPLSDAAVNTMLAACPNLRRLDLSFTLIKHPVLPSNKQLEKLVLTSTMIPSDKIVSLVSGLPKLKVLSLGAMGNNNFSTATVSPLSGTTITDGTLRALTSVLEGYPDLERVNLLLNTRIGYSAGSGSNAALSQFVTRVCRRCKRLNLSGLNYLRPSNLEGLANHDGPDEGPPRLEYLNLNNTPVDDTVAPYISSCVNLKTLELAGTKIGKDGLFDILDACEHLVKLDLTSCRGVNVGERRRFFEVWEEWKTS